MAAACSLTLLREKPKLLSKSTAAHFDPANAVLWRYRPTVPAGVKDFRRSIAGAFHLEYGGWS